jgi:hypothetical protein
MAYENYRFISWSAGTPITGDRLGQMSTNIDQVKDATDDNPRGLIEINQVTTNTPDTTGWSDFSEHTLISLEEDPPADNRVTLPASRWYRIVFVFPGIVLKDKGAEDSNFYIKMYEDGSPIPGATWRFTPHTYDYYDVSSGTGVTDTSIKAGGYPTRIGAGTYTFVSDSIAGFSNKTFSVAIKRDQGASANNAPAYYIPASEGYMQLYVEDIGGN